METLIDDYIQLRKVDKMIDLRHLEALITISKCESLSEAARQLYITQPALSRSMQKLENELELSLFEHGTSKATLNEAGQMAVSYAHAILNLVEEMQEKLRIIDRSLTTIFIGSCAPAPSWNLASYLSEHYPDATISPEINSDTDYLVVGLKDGLYKLIITQNQVDQNGILSIPYLRESLYLAVPRDHELASLEEVYLRDLNNITLILNSEIGFWEDLCRQKMKNPKFIIQDKLEDHLTLAQAINLPFFVTDLAIKRYPYTGERKLIHILDEEANVSYYCSCLLKDKKYLPNS